MVKRIAVLGWGSLLWDPRPEFDEQHHDWLPDGPTLKLEFCRISKSRRGALTLAIDSTNGAICRVAYTFSKRTDPEDAICDLRSREGTTRKNMGYVFIGGSRAQPRDEQLLKTIRDWAEPKKIEVVVWTNLGGNFEATCGERFSVNAALAHVQALDAEGKARAAAYVWRAPKFIDTPLRRALEAQPWFRP